MLEKKESFAPVLLIIGLVLVGVDGVGGEGC
jgi:hypothetical protein